MSSNATDKHTAVATQQSVGRMCKTDCAQGLGFWYITRFTAVFLSRRLPMCRKRHQSICSHI